MSQQTRMARALIAAARVKCGPYTIVRALQALDAPLPMYELAGPGLAPAGVGDDRAARFTEPAATILRAALNHAHALGVGEGRRTRRVSKKGKT